MTTIAASEGIYTIAVAGPPGTGKSWFAASVADAVGAAETLALITKPHEYNSYGYASRQIPREIFVDRGWIPSLGQYNADGYLRLLRRLHELQEDDRYGAIILDPFTDVAELAGNELLKIEKVGNPRDSSDGRSYYGALKYKLREITQLLVMLQFAARPKHVICTIHTQPSKEEGADASARGVAYEGSVLPALEGSYKYRFGSEFNCVLYSDISYAFDSKTKQREASYVLQVQPNTDRHSKLSLAPMLAGKTIPNNFQALLEAVGVQENTTA